MNSHQPMVLIVSLPFSPCAWSQGTFKVVATRSQLLEAAQVCVSGMTSLLADATPVPSTATEAPAAAREVFTTACSQLRLLLECDSVELSAVVQAVGVLRAGIAAATEPVLRGSTPCRFPGSDVLFAVHVVFPLH